MTRMNTRGKSSDLIIDRDTVRGSVVATGSLAHGSDVEAVIDAARLEDKDVVIILSHASVPVAREPEGGGSAAEEVSEEPAEPAASLRAVASAVARALGERESLLGLIDHLSPKTDVLPPPAVLQARRNAAARRELLEEHGVLSASEVSDLAGSSAHNRSALPARWRKEGRIFAIAFQGGAHYPAFQFDAEGRPHPVVADVLAAFRGIPMGEWEIALWFTARNGWLGDERPVDLLAGDPDAVREAATHEADPIAG